MVDFGSGQGRSDFETTGVVRLRRGFQKRENAGLGRKMPFMVDTRTYLKKRIRVPGKARSGEKAEHTRSM
jgi:hypothetical protein